ncbi:MAG: CPBP family intramembrane metalloprotease [SAR324 cluster bacterium]|nr:CPBP family intramembrane metalloprotease [SAR324 cluster bacterium]
MAKQKIKNQNLKKKDSKKSTKKKHREIKKRYAAQNLLVLSFGFAWLICGALYLFNDGIGGMIGYIAVIIILFVPALFTLLIYNKYLLEKLDLSLNPSLWYLVALFLPVIFSAASFGVSLLMPEVTYSWESSDWLLKFKGNFNPEQLAALEAGNHPFYLYSAQQIVFGATFATFFAFGEELGWRGLLLKEWGEDLGFWKASFLIGLFWGLWYIPLELMGRNFPDNPTEGAVITLIWCILLSPSVVWVKTKARSVAAAALFMGIMQGVTSSSSLLLVGASPTYSGLRSFSGVIVLLCFNGLLYFLVKPSLKIKNPEDIL